MSKMDALRAMREARYAETTARAKAAGPGGTAPTAKKAAAKAPVAKKAPAAKSSAPAPEAVAAAESDTELCGHRNMSGRSCTREKGHAAKSHRYS